MKHKIYILIIVLLSQCQILLAQSVDQVKKFFEKGEFAQARDMSEKLVKASPANGTYNYYYGACLYETGEKVRALPYLKKGVERKVIDAFRYLGKLYYDMYKFEDAVDCYEDHIEYLEQKGRATENAEAELNHIKIAARMIKSVENVMIIDSFAIAKKDFLNMYKLSEEAGSIKIGTEPESIVFTTEMKDKEIVSMRKDGYMKLFNRLKLLNDWGEPELIESLIEEDDTCNINYPFLMGDGTTLYYASDGENSLGGYDIFVTRYDLEDSEYLKSENLGMPFNSPANDYMYAIDELNNIGWFASDRYQPKDSVCVYAFVPNEVKRTYDYESTNPEELINAASLRSIKSNWKDDAKMRKARQQLATLRYTKKEEIKTNDFDFVIDDSTIYHFISDFKSAEAKNAYLLFMQKSKEYKQIQLTLDAKRGEYSAANNTKKQQLSMGILELEARAYSLNNELKQLEMKVRNAEISHYNKR